MPLKVLAIDDDPGMTALLGLLLRGYGMDVISANSSEFGLELARNEKPDIITLDLMLPNINGWQLCKMIRSFSKVPILVVSALDDPAGIARALEAGADDYLVKPVPSDLLVKSINKHAGKEQANDNQPAPN
jgi:DNA-binding response OmpR family regulator